MYLGLCLKFSTPICAFCWFILRIFMHVFTYTWHFLSTSFTYPTPTQFSGLNFYFTSSRKPLIFQITGDSPYSTPSCQWHTTSRNYFCNCFLLVFPTSEQKPSLSDSFAASLYWGQCLADGIHSKVDSMKDILVFLKHFISLYFVFCKRRHRFYCIL